MHTNDTDEFDANGNFIKRIMYFLSDSSRCKLLLQISDGFYLDTMTDLLHKQEIQVLFCRFIQLRFKINVNKVNCASLSD